MNNHLTKRELQILKLLTEGFTHKQISEKLLISKRTADVHVNNIMLKLDIHNKAGLVVHAIRNRIVKV